MSVRSILIVEPDDGESRFDGEKCRKKVGEGVSVHVVASIAVAEALLTELRERGEELLAVAVGESGHSGIAHQLLERVRAGFGAARTIVVCANGHCDTGAHADASIDEHVTAASWNEATERLGDVLRSAVESPIDPSAREEVTVIGDQWSRRSHELKNLLCRYHVPYRWIDVERDRRAVPEAAQQLSADELPLLLFHNGDALSAPEDADVAQRLGFKTEAESSFYDLIIVGGGPAGLAAAVYGSSEGLRVLVIDRDVPGGQAGSSSLIENYLGFPEGLSGAELSSRAVTQARRFGAEILSSREVAALEIDRTFRGVALDDGSHVSAHAVLVATGVSYKKLEAPGVDPLYGRGIYYGATAAEAARYADRDVALLGGGNSAGQAAMLLARYARKVHMVMIEPELGGTMSQYLVQRLSTTPSIEIIPSTSVVAVRGTEKLEALTLKDLKSEATRELDVEGLFIWIGATPRTDWLKSSVLVDDRGYVLSGRDVDDTHGDRRARMLLETSVDGVFVAGDVRSGSVKRIGSAVGEGAMAIQMIHEYLRDR